MGSLQDSVQYVKGVGPARAKLLERMGIQTIEDLLHYFPRDYLDRSVLTPIGMLVEDRQATFRGKVVDVELRPLGPR